MLRVIQWATGVVGRHAARAVLDHPELQLVGGYVYGGDKVGRDLGEICGSGPIGVRATNDKAAILATSADCVLYMPGGSATSKPCSMTSARSWLQARTSSPRR